MTNEGQKKFLDTIRRKRKLYELCEKESEPNFWSGIAKLGIIGWLVILPTMLGAFSGRFLDRRFDKGIFWTLTLIMAGLAIGCYNAWRSMK
ncbi:MAG: AtpZ/AtpI family protein [Desulfobacteria bacterium]|nr:AtpZ/AtpI family protein [Desulfobacterales bacterium]MDL1978222.1 AtpZ/AtpI family protein [Deltaproteobacteria bacterium]